MVWAVNVLSEDHITVNVVLKRAVCQLQWIVNANQKYCADKGIICCSSYLRICQYLLKDKYSYNAGQEGAYSTHRFFGFSLF